MISIGRKGEKASIQRKEGWKEERMLEEKGWNGREESQKKYREI